MNPRIYDYLNQLYGETATAGIAGRLETMLKRCGAAGETTRSQRPRAPLTQRDAMLITYADQVSMAGEPPLRTLGEFCARRLKNVVSGVHILPFYPWSSDDGFSVKDYFAVEPGYGSWEDIFRLGSGFDLMFDAVFNHISSQSEWFRLFQSGDPHYTGFFITVAGNPDLSQVVRPRALPLLTEFPTARGPQKVWTTFSADQVDLNFKNPQVLLALLEALLFYTSRGARFIRLDAIAFLWKEFDTTCLHLPQTHKLIQLMRAVLDDAAPQSLLVTETNVPHCDNISYFGDGANEAQLVYNFALPPLVLHAMQTGGAESLTRWARSLSLPSDRVTFLNFLASHDGIGLNPARGILSGAEIDAMAGRTLAHGGFISYKDMPDGSRLPYEMNINYLDALSAPASREPVELAARKLLAAHAILLSLQGVPAIYFHSMFGSRGDRAGAESSGIPRRINREKLDLVRLESQLSEAGSLRALAWHGMQTLLQIRAGQEAFHPQAEQEVLSAGKQVFAVCRAATNTKNQILCLHNVSAERAQATVATSPAAFPGIWIDLLTDRRFGPDITHVDLAPYETLWLRRETV